MMNDDSKKSNNESGGSSEHYQSRLESVETIGDSGHAPLPPLQIANDVEQQQQRVANSNSINYDAMKKSAMSGIRSAMNSNQRVQQVHHASSGFGSSRLRTTRPRNDEIDRTTMTPSSTTQQQPHNTLSGSGVSIDEEQNISQGTGGSIDEEATTELVPLDAVVVEEEVDVPIYDGVVIQPDDDDQQAQSTSCIKRNQKCLVIVLILVIVAMAAIVGGILGSQSKNDTNEKNDDSSSNASGEILVATSSTTSAPSPLFRKSTSLPSLSPSSSFLPTSSKPTLQPISSAPTKLLYYADWSIDDVVMIRRISQVPILVSNCMNESKIVVPPLFII